MCTLSPQSISLILHPVSAEYFDSLDRNPTRLDDKEHPELTKGTVDFVVPEEYWAINPPQGLTVPYHTHQPRRTGSRPPEPMRYIFAFDVSREAVQLGFLRSACACVSRILFGGTSADDAPLDACFPPECSVAFLTYDSTIHFYDLSVRLHHSVHAVRFISIQTDPVRMLVVSDIEEVFVPLQRGLFVNPVQRRYALYCRFLDMVYTLLQGNPQVFLRDITYPFSEWPALRSRPWFSPPLLSRFPRE